MHTKQIKFALLLVAVGVGVFFGSSHWQTVQAVSVDTSAHQAMIQEYCVACHNEKSKTADVSLVGLDYQNVAKNGDTWEKVLRKVRTGQMPPVKVPHPEAKEVTSFVNWLEGELDKAAAAHPNPGRQSVHRLNRAEYSNAIRDLLALDIKPGNNLPIDDSGYGFDNIGDVLSLSPALLEKYMSVAFRISRTAVGDLKMKPGEDVLQARRDPPKLFGGAVRTERVSDDLPFYSRGGASFQYYFPVDAEYQLRIKMPGDNSKPIDVKMAIKAGLRNIGVTFMRDSAKPEVAMPAVGRPGGPPPGGGSSEKIQMDLRLDGVRINQSPVSQFTNVDTIIVSGPFNATARGNTPSREKIFICQPTSEKDERPCARKILTNLTRRAFRRPVTTADIAPLLAFYDKGRLNTDFDTGIQSALEAMLVSPDFLFRIERDQRAAKSDVARINDFELASRLSFFLWSSIPDEELFALAEQKKLSDPATLQAQVTRLLDDPRSQAFVSNFGGQWLYLRNLETQKPDPDMFPNFDDSLRQSFRQETELFFGSVLRENRSILNLLDADYTFLNQRLAEHYEIPGVYGSQFRRVKLNDPNRGGLLGQGSILTVTSYPNRTSVVQRGKWVLENLLGAPPPPPPADIPDLKPHGKDGRLLSMREQLESHRANPTCASCHARMDPIGFALENFDGIGKWRTKDAGLPIDASGKLPSGKSFTGSNELKKVLLTAHKDEFVTAVTEKLLTYALGRGLEYYDSPTVRSIMRETAPTNYQLSTLISSIVKSTPFQMRRTATP